MEKKMVIIQDRILEVTNNGTSELVPDNGYDGLGKVSLTVNVPQSSTLQEVSKTYVRNGVETIVPEQGFDGISKATVTVDIPEPVLVPLSAVENREYLPADGEDGFSSVNVQVPIPEPDIEERTVDITENGTQTIVPTEGFDGMGKVTVNTKVPGAGGKVSVLENRLKFGYADFETIPDTLDFTGVTDMSLMFSESPTLVNVPEWFSTKGVTSTNLMFRSCTKLENIPISFDSSEYSDASNMFHSCGKLKSVHFTGGMKPGCNTTNMFDGITTDGMFFYDLPGDYTPAINVLPASWKYQALGTFPLKIRILKDAAWVSGEQNLTLDGQPVAYKGKGLYEISVTLTKDDYLTKVTELLLDGVKIGDVKLQAEEQIIEMGDNSSVVIEKTGADILTLVPEGGNVDGWAYDETVQGVKSAKIGGGGSTTLKLGVNGEFYMTYGQESESNYDYAEMKNGAGVKITDFKGKNTGVGGSQVFNGMTDDGVIQITYKKDGSGDQGQDAFWIKSMKLNNLPPYPEV